MGKKRQPIVRETVLIAPSVLSSDFSNLAGEIRKIKQAKCPWVHFDVMDGHFVPNLTFGPLIVEALRPLGRGLFFDVHLMIDDPLFYAPAFIEAGADLITFHLEIEEKADRIIRYLHRHGVKAGISIKPKTPLEELEPYLRRLDLVMVMTVEPGFGGQKMIPQALNKVRQLRLHKEKKRLNFLIEVDGGINEKTTPLAVAAGADVLVAGSFVFKDGRVSQKVQRLRKAISLGLNGAVKGQDDDA